MEQPSVEVFTELHRPQFQAIGFPPPLIPRLFSKLVTKSKEDLSCYFELCSANTCYGTGEVVPSCIGYGLKSKVDLQPKADVFILQHAWESDGREEARKQLLEDPQLLLRVEELLGLQHGRKEEERVEDKMVKLVCCQSGKSRKVAHKALSDTSYDLIAAIVAAESQTDADCEEKESNRRPAPTFEEFKQGMLTTVGLKATIPDGDLQYLYQDYLKQKPVLDSSGIINCGHYTWVESDEDGIINVTVSIPLGSKKRDIVSNLRPKHWVFGLRGQKPIIDRAFSSAVVPDESFWTLEGDAVSMSLQKAYPDEKWQSLLVGEVQLGQREVEKLVKLSSHRLNARVDAVMQRMWYVNQTYQAVTPEGQQKPLWYLLEQFGLALTHSVSPSFQCKPFANALTGKVMSLLWPVKEVARGDVCTRDFVPPLFPGESVEQRKAREEAIMSFAQEGGWKSVSPETIVTPQAVGNGRSENGATFSPPTPSTVVRLLVAGSTGSEEEWMPVEGYTVVKSAEEADVILGHSEVVSASRGQLVARLMGDEWLANKSLFCKLARHKECCVESVDVMSEAAALLCEEPVVASWRILLPSEKGSAVRPRVTRNKVELVRWAEVGPCVASKFLVLPVLYKKHSFCLQFTVVARQGLSLEVFLHTQPRVRLAKKERAGFDPWDTATMLTSAVCTAPWDDFLTDFTAQYKASWTDTQHKTNNAIAGLFTGTKLCGSAAVYSVDVLLQHPSLLPLIIGSDPIPSFSNTVVAQQCLDLLVGRATPGDDFVQLI